MIVPRRLFLLADGRFCEEDDVRQAMNFRAAGYPIPDAEAERIGLKAYLDETGWGPVAGVKEKPAVKAVAQTQVEDKAVEGPGSHMKAAEAEPKVEEESHDLEPGLHIDPALRRGGRRGP